MLQKKLAEIREVCAEDLDMIAGAASEPSQILTSTLLSAITPDGHFYSYAAQDDMASD